MKPLHTQGKNRHIRQPCYESRPRRHHDIIKVLQPWEYISRTSLHLRLIRSSRGKTSLSLIKPHQLDLGSSWNAYLLHYERRQPGMLPSLSKILHELPVYWVPRRASRPRPRSHHTMTAQTNGAYTWRTLAWTSRWASTLPVTRIHVLTMRRSSLSSSTKKRIKSTSRKRGGQTRSLSRSTRSLVMDSTSSRGMANRMERCIDRRTCRRCLDTLRKTRHKGICTDSLSCGQLNGLAYSSSEGLFASLTRWVRLAVRNYGGFGCCLDLNFQSFGYEAEGAGYRHVKVAHAIDSVGKSPAFFFSGLLAKLKSKESAPFKITIAAFSGNHPEADSHIQRANGGLPSGFCAQIWALAFVFVPGPGAVILKYSTLMHLRVGPRGLRHPTPGPPRHTRQISGEDPFKCAW